MNVKVTHIQFDTTPFTLKEQGKKEKEWGYAIEASARNLKTALDIIAKTKKKKKDKLDMKGAMLLFKIKLPPDFNYPVNNDSM